MNESFKGEQQNRRQFLKAAGTLAVAQIVPARAKAIATTSGNGRTLAYVGTYTGAPGSGSNGEGIYLFEMNTASGELMNRRLVAKTPNPSWIAIHPSKKYLYAVNEVTDYRGNSGSVSAFAIDAARGELTPINVVSSEGAGPCYLSIDAAGRYAFVANYAGGTIASLPILDGGSLGAAVSRIEHTGHLGAAAAKNAPTGSFAVSGHDGPHAHMILPDPQGNFVLATDLGQDRIYTYKFESATGKLIPVEGAAFMALPSGDGPRHFAFHPNGDWVYAIQEEASNIVFFHYDRRNGSLAAQQTVSALPVGFAGTSFASEVMVAPHGRFLYAANRLHDTIACFSIGGDGQLKWLGEASTMGDYPGQCRIDPSGRFIYACNRKSDDITCFEIRGNGLPVFTGRYTAVGSAASITFLA